eukprot:gene23507-31858_t
MLPNIKLSSRDSNLQQNQYTVNLEDINDLFYDKKTDPVSETQRVQSVLDRHRSKINALYFSSELTSREKTCAMNREGFCHFANKTVGIPHKNANEIFSCATNLYSEEDAHDDFGLPDAFMTTSQFAAGIVRLANIAAMIDDGMIDTSKLAKQTEAFLSKV